MQALLSLWLRELIAGETPSLQQVLDDVGRKADHKNCGRPGITDGKKNGPVRQGPDRKNRARPATTGA